MNGRIMNRKPITDAATDLEVLAIVMAFGIAESDATARRMTAVLSAIDRHATLATVPSVAEIQDWARMFGTVATNAGDLRDSKPVVDALSRRASREMAARAVSMTDCIITRFSGNA
jgi:hypothetical protein